jgi:DNA-binding Lrp family transcriptional regulator
VQQGMDNLERKGIIESYTIKINPHHQQQQVSAYIMISIVSQNTPEITRQIQKLNQLDMLCTISGQYDLMAMVSEESTEALDRVIDSIAALEGVEKNLNSHRIIQKKGSNALNQISAPILLIR